MPRVFALLAAFAAVSLAAGSAAKVTPLVATYSMDDAARKVEVSNVWYRT